LPIYHPPLLQQQEPEDFVIATGITTSVRDFVKIAFAHAGVEVTFEGDKEQEVGIATKILNPDCKTEVGQVVVEVDKRYFRPTEVDLLLGDATKAKEKLGWVPECTLDQLAKEMVISDIEYFSKELLLKQSGYRTLNQYE